MPKNVIMDGSMLNNLQACPYKFWLNHELDLVANDKSVPLEEGDLLHHMYEFFNTVKMRDPSIVYDELRFHSALADAISHGERHCVEQNLTPSEADEVIYQFKAHVLHEQFNGERVLEVEKPFLITLYEDEDYRIHYAGKIDLIVDKPHFGVCVKDFKKKSRTSPPEPLSNQFTGYSYATKIKTVIVDEVGFQKSLEPQKRFKEFPVYYTDDQWEAWKVDTIWWGHMLIYHMEENRWPRNRTSCDKYNGCVYGKICNSSTEDGRASIMNGLYTKAPHWDPTSVLARKKINLEEVK